jgi:hypothetical protein
MEIDFIAIIGIGATFIVSSISLIISVRNSKKTLFINSITASRIKWIGDIRNDISAFCGLTFHFAVTKIKNEDEKQQIMKDIDRLGYKIKLQLNRGDDFDKRLIAKINTIPDLTEEDKYEELKEQIDELEELTQDLLKLEWERVKQESIKGILSEKEKKKLYDEYLAKKQIKDSKE